MYLVIFLIAAVSIWAFDLHELFIREKRADRIKMIQADIQWFVNIGRTGMEKISGFWKKLNPYIVRFLKFLLRLTGKLFCLAVKLLKWLFQELKETIQEIKDYNHQINPALLLTFEENLELAKALDGHPYEAPVFENYWIDHYVAVSYEFSTAGKTPRYETVAPEEFDLITVQEIKGFWAKKRKVQVYVRIIAATPTYLHFAVTYTPYGWNRLMQVYPPLENAKPLTPPPPLEESISEEKEAEEEEPGNEEEEPWF